MDIVHDSGVVQGGIVMPMITEEGRLRRGRGTGEGKDYKPWLENREVNSMGTASEVIDYKTGRQVHLLSQGEVYWYYLLRWRDDVTDIREQFPLELEMTVEISRKLGFRHPYNEKTRMTTDMLITKTDGTYEAYSVKTDKSVLDNARNIEKLYIEKLYWDSLQIPFHIVYKSDVNWTLVKNIMDVTACYDDGCVYDAYSALRHKIAHKEIIVDMESRLLDYKAIIENMRNGGIRWLN